MGLVVELPPETLPFPTVAVAGAGQAPEGDIFAALLASLEPTTASPAPGGELPPPATGRDKPARTGDADLPAAIVLAWAPLASLPAASAPATAAPADAPPSPASPARQYAPAASATVASSDPGPLPAEVPDSPPPGAAASAELPTLDLAGHATAGSPPEAVATPPAASPSAAPPGGQGQPQQSATGRDAPEPHIAQPTGAVRIVGSANLVAEPAEEAATSRSTAPSRSTQNAQPSTHRPAPAPPAAAVSVPHVSPPAVEAPAASPAPLSEPAEAPPSLPERIENLDAVVTAVFEQGEDGAGAARLRLEPAGLGEITVRLHARHDAVHLDIHAETPEAVALLRDAAADLSSLLGQRGMNLSGLNIGLGTRQDGAADASDRRPGGRPPADGEFAAILGIDDPGAAARHARLRAAYNPDGSLLYRI